MKKGSGAKSKFRFKEAKEFEEEVLQIDRVTRVVKGGRRLRFRVTVIIGDRKGRIGIGIGKSNEVVGGIQKAISKAKKSVVKICIYDDTIPHEVNNKFKAAKVLLMPAGPGTGLIAGGAVRRVLELAGVKNILSKRLGSTNKINNAKATFYALQGMTWRESTKKKKEEEKDLALTSEKDAEATTKRKPVPKKAKDKAGHKNKAADSKKEEDTNKSNKSKDKVKPKPKTDVVKGDKKVDSKAKAKKEDKKDAKDSKKDKEAK